MTARVYYNEHDRFAAAWLRELIAHGHIAAGEVDERSIVDVSAGDLAGYTQCHFFAGIGVWSYALRRAGWADDAPVWTGSCPCQPFSDAGKGEGADDHRHLWPTWFRLIRECGPHVVFGEQVASTAGLAWLDVVSTDLEGAGYAVGAADLCAAGVGAPHIRQRLYFVADASGDGARQHARELPRDEGEHEVGRAHGDHASVAGGAARALAESSEGGRAEFGTARLHGRRPGASGGAPAEGGAHRARGHDADGCGAPRELGDAEDERHERRAGTGREAWRGTQLSGLVGDAAELGPQGSGSRARGESDRAAQPGRRSPDDGLVGDAPSGGRGERRDAARPGRGGHPHGAIVAGELDLTAGGRRSRRGNEPAHREFGPAGAVTGFWSDAEWIPCIDGKARPVEPGTFPLVAGAPARVGRLRGYGNALNAEVAIAFVEAYLEVIA